MSFRWLQFEVTKDLITKSINSQSEESGTLSYQLHLPTYLYITQQFRFLPPEEAAEFFLPQHKKLTWSLFNIPH